MNYTVSVSELGETCVYTLQTSEPGIHPEMLQTDEPKGSGNRCKPQSEATPFTQLVQGMTAVPELWFTEHCKSYTASCPSIPALEWRDSLFHLCPMHICNITADADTR